MHFVRRHTGAVTRPRFDPDQHRRITGLCLLQRSRVLEAVPGHDAVIGVGRRYHDRRVHRAFAEYCDRGNTSRSAVKLFRIIR